MSSFVADYLAGRTSLDRVDDYVERWHARGEHPEDLPTFLGLNSNEYSRWVEDPASLRQILSARLAAHSKRIGDSERMSR